MRAPSPSRHRQNGLLTDSRKVRRGANCGAPTPMPVPSRNVVAAIEHVEHRQAGLELAHHRQVEIARGAEVQLPVRRQVVGVGKAVAQAGAEQGIGQPGRSPVLVRHPGRRGQALVVVEVDPVAVDVGQLRVVEVELAGLDALALRARHAQVQVRAEITLAVVGAGLQPVDAAAFVVEGREQQRVAELAFILQVAHVAIIGVQAQRQVRRELVRDAEVEE